MFSLPNGKVTVGQILLPVGLVALVLCANLAYQLTQILTAREDMRQLSVQQDKPLQEAQRVQNQLNALAVGTLKLSEKGDKNAKAIIDRMKKLGITVSDKPQQPGGMPSMMPPSAGAGPQGGPPPDAAMRPSAPLSPSNDEPPPIDR